MTVQFGCVVEGHGEREAVPVLLRRIVQCIDPAISVEVRHPVRFPKSRLLKAGNLERAVQQAALGLGGAAAILVLLDSDNDAPCILGPELLARAQAARADLPVGVVLPQREFEAWFLAAARSLRGHRGLPEDLDPPEEPELVPGAKEWLSRRMGRHGYSAPLDQPALAALFDMQQALRTGSLDKCYREVQRLLRELSIRQSQRL